MKRIPLFLLLAAVAVLAGLLYGQEQSRQVAQKTQQRLEETIRTQQNLIDSLRNEDFIHSSNETRYGIALEWLKEESPECAARMEKILSTKTE